MNPIKILFGNKEEREMVPSDKPGYFCSELVASTYKAIGLLPENISSSSYWPS